jgi:hypothetical protein
MSPAAHRFEDSVVSNPMLQSVSREAPVGKRENGPLLFVDIGGQARAVQQKEHFHRGVANALVPVDEAVAADQTETQDGGFGDQA